MRVDNMADNANTTHLQEANHHDTRPRLMQEVNSLRTDSRMLRVEHCIVGIPQYSVSIYNTEICHISVFVTVTL